MRTGILIAVACAALPVCSQTIDRTKPPVSPEPKPFRLPVTTETKLPNGLTVVMAQDNRFPLVTMRLAFAAGNKFDPKGVPGLAGSVAGMLMQGTTSRSYQQIAEQLDGLGGTMSAGSGNDSLAINGSILAENLPKLLELTADVARNATFPQAELDLHKTNRIQGYRSQHALPAFLANEEFRKRIFGDHPYAQIGPTLAAIEKVDYAALTAFRGTYLVPNNAYLVLVGKLPARAILLKTISDQFGSWTGKPVPAYAPAAPPAAKKQLVLVDRPGSVQADIHMGNIGPTYRDADYFPEVVASIVLGTGPNSRLFMDVREKKNYAYDVHSEIGSMADAGTFAAVSQFRNEIVGDAVQALTGHLDRMGKEPVTGEELSEAKSFASGLYVMRLEAQAGLADQLAQMRIAGLPKDYLETYVTRIKSVEPDQIQKAAQKFIATGSNTLVIVGDAATLQPALEKIGKFEVVKPN